ncbi:hypothetical protein MRA01_57700 [Methylobacterium radiotolerans]|nr:hypothetical protein MRA01_57700 [Methylobacterium radiotolerans]
MVMISSERFQTSFDSGASEIKRAASLPRKTPRLRAGDRARAEAGRGEAAATGYSGHGAAVSDLAKDRPIR